MSERTIFLNALDIADPAARSQFLDRECAGDEGLRRQVDALLTAHSGAGEFLEKPAIPAVMTPPESRAGEGVTTSADSNVKEMHGQSQAAHPERGPDAARTQIFGEGSPADGFPFLPPTHRADAIGRLSHYEILSPLGKGAFGSVFKAFDTRLDRIVAVKILAPELAASGGARRRFIREAKSAASVRHEHVVDIHAVDEEPIPYLVMECIIGQTLQQKLDRNGPLPVLEILRIGYQIATGLSAAHALGLIHRDIKPANILLENGVERVKITDFGLARAGDDASLTQSGIVCGTPMYMAPEQAQGEALDGRADLFSLGSTLYAMCTGRPPFRATTTMAVLKRVVEDHPRPIREINPEIPEWLCEIVDKLLAKKPADRFQSAREVAALFSQHLAHLQHPQTPAPPRVGRLRTESAPLSVIPTRPHREDEEEPESVSTFVGSLLVFLPIFSLLAALLGAIRKGIPSSLQESPDDVARTLMVLLGGLAASAGLFAWWFGGTTRKIASSLAAAALLLSIGEGLRWIRVGESGVPAIASNSLPERPKTGAPIIHSPANPEAGDRIDLLAAEPTSRFAAATPGASVKDRTLVLKHSSGDKPVQFSLTGLPFHTGEVRLRAVCLKRDPEFMLSIGLSHGGGTPRRVDAALRTASESDPVGLHLWQYDEAFQSSTLGKAPTEPVEPGRELELRISVMNGDVIARVGSTSVEAKGALSANRDVVPYLGLSGSEWRILEWTLKTDDPAGPVDLLNWGRFVNPSDLAALERAYNSAVIEVPGSRPFNLVPGAEGNLDAPRLLQEVEGDFEISVAIPPFDGGFPGTDSRSGGKTGDREAGLVLWQDDRTFLRFGRSSAGESPSGAPTLHAEWYVDGMRAGDERDLVKEPIGARPAEPTVVRIHRWGNQLQLSWSRDGLTWTDWRTVANLPFASRLQVGLFVQNSTNTAFQARFDRFRLRAKEIPDRSLARVPFSSKQAVEWQATAAKEAGVPVQYDNSIGMSLRLIPAGEFTMGLAVEEINDVLKRPYQEGLDKGLMEFMTYASGPQHKVRLTRSYYVGTTEVTVGQFRLFVEETGYKPSDTIAENETPAWLKPASEETDRLPATRVTWHEARKFCRWLSEKEGVEYTLPTDAQWEFACRAGSPEKWPHGDDRDELKDYAWYGFGYHDAPHGVGLKKPNAFGLYDMLGNAHEWAQDWHQQAFYSHSPLLDPVCTQPGVGRVCRGGWWWDSADLIRSASRGYNVPDLRYPGCGFRVAIVPPFGKLRQPVESAPPSAEEEKVSGARLSAPLDFTGSLIGAGGFFSLTATDDGSRVVAGSFHGKIGIWNTATREQIRVIDAHDSTIHGLLLTPDQRHIVSAAEDGLIRKWNLEDGEKVLEFVGHTGRVDSLAIVGESGRETLISATADFVRKAEHDIRAWDLATGEPRQKFAGDIGFIGCMAVIPGADRVVTCDFLHRRISLWDVSSGTLLRFATGGSLLSLAVDPSGKSLVTGHASRQQVDGRWDDPEGSILQLRDAETLEPGRVFRGHRGPVNSVAFSPDGMRLVSVSGGAHGPEGDYADSVDNSVRVWDVEKGTEVARQGSEDRLLRVTFLPDGRFVTGGNDHLRLWELE